MIGGFNNYFYFQSKLINEEYEEKMKEKYKNYIEKNKENPLTYENYKRKQIIPNIIKKAKILSLFKTILR